MPRPESILRLHRLVQGRSQGPQLGERREERGAVTTLDRQPGTQVEHLRGARHEALGGRQGRRRFVQPAGAEGLLGAVVVGLAECHALLAVGFLEEVGAA